MKIRFATIGTSAITDKFITASKLCPDLIHTGVYSRSSETAKAFAQKHNVLKTYTSLEALAKDPDIDAVYIASPNAFHSSQTLQMIAAGKHVICEKSIASNAQEAQIMVDAARQKGVVLLEAMRSIKDPGFAFIKDHLPSLGDIRQATFSFCQYSSRYDRFKAGQSFNIFSFDMSAGALMDIGVYCVEPMIALFDLPEQISCTAVKLDNGIDGNGTIMAQYPTMNVNLLYSKITDGHAPSEIQGEAGTILIDAIACPHHVKILYRNGQTKSFDLNDETNNMHYEARYFSELIATGTFPEAETAITLKSIQLMDQARKQLGIRFPADNMAN